MNYVYTIIENQFMADGSKGLLYNHFTSENDALACYYTKCAAATQSSIAYHSVHMLRSDGVIVKQEIFDRR